MNHSQTRRSHPACPRLGKEAGSGFPGRCLRRSARPGTGLAGGSGPSAGTDSAGDGRSQKAGVAAPSLRPPRPMRQEGWQEGPLGP